MGFENDRIGRGPFFGEPSAADKRSLELGRARIEEERLAAVEMAHELANLVCPEDIKAFGRRHGIPNFTKVVWNAGFFAGYRQARRSGLAPFDEEATE